MVAVTTRPTTRPVREVDEAAIYELLRTAPRTPADIAAALQVEQMYIDQHLSFQAVTGVIAQSGGYYSTWRSDLK